MADADEMVEAQELQAEFEALIEEFGAGHQRFLHYLRGGRMAECRAVNAQMQASLDRQREIQARLVAILGEKP